MSLPRLITLAPSNYSEKARWAFDRFALPYVEDCRAPLLHLWALRQVGGKSLPTLVLPSGDVLKDSTDILHHLDTLVPEAWRLFPAAHRAEVMTLEDELDETLGPAVARWIHSWVFDHRANLELTLERRVPAAQRRMFPVLLPPTASYFKGRLTKHRKSHDDHFRHLGYIWASFDRRLADGRKYLVGDRLTAADVTLAALGAHVVSAPEFGGGVIPLERLPQPTHDQVAGFRESATGQFVLRLYREERAVVLGQAT